ncbi:hypothetical protein SUDANB176_00235 [Streptomyces sp. enrichment culture]
MATDAYESTDETGSDDLTVGKRALLRVSPGRRRRPARPGVRAWPPRAPGTQRRVPVEEPELTGGRERVGEGLAKLRVERVEGVELGTLEQVFGVWRIGAAAAGGAAGRSGTVHRAAR